jgi:hypothetical protein
MAARYAICAGDRPLSSLSPQGARNPEVAHHAEATAARAAAALVGGAVHVERRWLRGAPLDAARAAASATRRDVPAEAAPDAALVGVVESIDALRAALAAATGRPLLPTAELDVVSYRAGGRYRRHLDDGGGVAVGTGGRPVRRSISLLVYLTDDDWDVATDGGALRVYPAGAPPLDVPPEPGCLVLFDSAAVPHEVLTTHRPRLLMAGWLQEMRTS